MQPPELAVAAATEAGLVDGCSTTAAHARRDSPATEPTREGNAADVGAVIVTKAQKKSARTRHGVLGVADAAAA